MNAKLALFDLTEGDPARCGLGWDRAALHVILEEGCSPPGEPPDRIRARACDAVASYVGRNAALAGDRIRFAGSRGGALCLALSAVARRGEVLVPLPGDPDLERVAQSAGADVIRYPLTYDGAWHLDRKALARSITARTRAIVLGNPSVPAGAMLSGEDLAFVEALCSARHVALVGDEAFIDTAREPCASVLQVTRCLAIHVSGLSGVCGLRELGAEWLGVAGPDHLAADALARIDAALAESGAGLAMGPLGAAPALLARREVFLGALRSRLAGNRAALATAALREAPWSLCWGHGGPWGVLRIGGAEPDEAFCDALLDEDRVAVHPGSRYGLGGDEHLVVSLLPPPDVFHEALQRLDRRLRSPS